MTAYVLTVAAFWIAVALLTLLACRAIDRASAVISTCLERRRAYLSRSRS